MAAYTGFARLYDLFMDDIPYGEWCEYLEGLLREWGVEDGLVLELGCGTGTVTELLAQDGYDMIGVDSSAEMLEMAWEKRERLGHDILYLQQDMREFELYGTVRAIVSICDSMNYLTREEDVRQVLSLANNYLDPGGVFIFDLKTAYYFREIMGDCTLTDQREEATLIWENAYYEEEQINEYDLTLFIRRENGFYEKETESHLQRAYDMEVIKRLIEEAGMECEAVYDAFTRKPARPDSQRIYVIARECTKQRR